MDKSQFPPVLILGAHLKSSLAAIRSLGARSIHVIAGADHGAAMGLHSRYTSEKFTYPSPLKSRSRFVEAVGRAADNCRRPPVLFSFSDATFLPLYESRYRLSDRLLAVYPETQRSVETAFSKAETVKLAAKLGIETPETRLFEDLSEWGYPVVLKPCHSVTWHGESGTQNRVRFAFSAEEAKRACEEIARQTGELPLLQEYIAGEELGVEFLCRSGEVLAAFAHRRIRSSSPAGGAAAVSQAIAEDYKGIGERARCLVAALGWSGPAMVEFKVDGRDGRAKLVEINGRFWGSLPLAVFAGVDFPWLYYGLATGLEVARPLGYREGVSSRHWLGDLLHLIRVLFRRDPMRALVFPKRRTALGDFLFPVDSSQADVASEDDPGPVVAEIVDAVWRRFGAGT